MVSIYVIIVQGKTVGPKATVIRVKDIKVDYLLTHLAPWITILFRYAAKTPSIRGPFEEDVMHYELLTCGVKECEHGGGWYGYRSEARGGEDKWKSSWLSDDAASSSSEDMSTTAGWRDVMCVRRAYAYSLLRGVGIHLCNSFCRTWAGEFPSTNRVVSSAEKEVKEGRSSSHVSR